MTEQEEQAFRALVDVEYWAACHEDEEQTIAENESDAKLYVDADTGFCGCCGVDYRNITTRPHLAALAVTYPNDLTMRSLQQRPTLEGTH